MGILDVKNVNKRFGGLQALGDVNLTLQKTRYMPSSDLTVLASPPCSTVSWAN